MTLPMLHVVQISFFADRQGRSPSQLLEAWSTLRDVAEAARSAGVRVSVVQACSRAERLQRLGVWYYFLPFGEMLGPAVGKAALSELLGKLAPDVLHVHGLDFGSDVVALKALAPATPIVLQDHASRPPRIWRRASWRRANSVASGIAFCALEQARPFTEAGLIGPQTRVYEIPESTTHFSPGDRKEARRVTGIEGSPAVLWVGHLDTNKDPLTVLEAIARAARVLPGLRLYCYYGNAPVLSNVQERIAKDPELRDRVQLVGRVPHERIEWLMRAADLFILGSHREGSGYALIEALACGLPPVVTDIPSFRALTGSGKVGMLWPPEDPDAASAAVQSMADRLGPERRASVRTHFERELSPLALGLKLAAMYEDVLQRSGATMLATQHRAESR